ARRGDHRHDRRPDRQADVDVKQKRQRGNDNQSAAESQERAEKSGDEGDRSHREHEQQRRHQKRILAAIPFPVGITATFARTWFNVMDFATAWPIIPPARTSDAKCTRSCTRARATLVASPYAIAGM